MSACGLEWRGGVRGVGERDECLTYMRNRCRLKLNKQKLARCCSQSEGEAIHAFSESYLRY